MQTYMGSAVLGLEGMRESWEDSRATLHLTTEERMVWGPKPTLGSTTSESSLRHGTQCEQLSRQPVKVEGLDCGSIRLYCLPQE